MTIVDIFDALTAGDRPYKPPLSVDVSCRILREMAEGGKIHGDAVELFFTKRLWDGVLRERKVG
jgi:HD-GYP domain-containing protein (c-di-GMP phosphodiesterase class II)